MRGQFRQRAATWVQYGLLILACVLMNIPPLRLKPVQATHGSGTHLYLFWDGGAAPSGWTIITAYDGMFPRGDSIADFGTTGISGAHVPTTSSVTTSPNTFQSINSGNEVVADVNHTHPAASVTVGAASNNDEPAFRTMKLIRYDAGIPSFIPSGAIAMFDSVPTSGWTRVTANDDRFIKVNSTVANGGSDAHTHSLTWGGLGASIGTAQRWNFFVTNGIIATSGHTHNAPAATSTASVTTLPPHVRPLLAKANSDTIAIPANLLGMFDGDAGSGWVHRSETGQSFNEQLLRPGATYNSTSQGVTSHTHANAAAVTGFNVGATGNFNVSAGNVAGNHTHTLTATFNSAENIPNYFNIAIAEKINFIMRDYRWYEDTDAEDVTDPWGRINVAQNAAITTVPPRNDPPDLQQELRLRMKIEVSGENLPANDIGFKLQYKEGTDQNCSSGSWTDIGAGGGGSIWRFATSSVPDGELLTTSRLSPTSSNLEMYVKTNDALLNPIGSTVGNTIEYDFHIEHNGANTGTVYSFRMIEGGGALLAEYAVCPTLTTKAGTDQQLRHGNVFESETERGFTWAD